MSGLLLPARVARELQERRDSYRADVLASLDLTDTDGLMTEYCRKLQAYDRRLLLVRAAETVVPGVPMKPGYYHLLIDNGPGVPLSVTTIEGELGEFTEPTSRIFEKLLAGDMREQRNLDRFAQTEARRFADVERDKQRDREERHDHLRELVKAYTETQVSMNTSRPWTQNNSAAARRDAGQRKG